KRFRGMPDSIQFLVLYRNSDQLDAQRSSTAAGRDAHSSRADRRNVRGAHASSRFFRLAGCRPEFPGLGPDCVWKWDVKTDQRHKMAPTEYPISEVRMQSMEPSVMPWLLRTSCPFLYEN